MAAPDLRTRAVAFDLDGVLIDGMQFHIEAWLDAFVGIGVEVDAKLFYLLEGISTREVVDRIVAERELGLDERARADLAARKRARYRELFRVVELRGARSLVHAAVSLGYHLALVTGTTRESGERALSELGLREHFSLVVSGDDVEHGKPAPDPYLSAWHALEVPAAHCLAIENAPAGVAAARAAGLPCLGIATYLPPETLAQADVVVSDTEAARTWLLAEAERSSHSGPFTVDRKSG